LITGAAGNIGSRLTRAFAGRYDLLLSDVREPADTAGAPFVRADLADLDAMRALCQGVDTVVHLGADPSMHAVWESLLPNNLVGAYNTFLAAKEAGCRRLVFASSVNAVFGYPPDVQVHLGAPVRPINLYGATKCWGEALASVFSEQGLSCLCLRFGWVIARDDEQLVPGHEYLDIALTYEDLAQLVGCAIDAPDSLRLGTFHGTSNNLFKRLDITESRRALGYAPVDDAFALTGMV
jgi:nucleoside-diphosphate-sugar epimerase